MPTPSIYCFLFDGAISALIKAEIYLEQNNMVAKGNAISKAINIIDNGLKMALDMEKGNEISRNLVAIYDYFIRQLMQANLKKRRCRDQTRAYAID